MEYQIINNLSSVKLALFSVEGIQAVKHNDSLWQKISDLSYELKMKYNIEKLNDISVVQSVREMFKLEGMDPTRYRPSSEALLRRIIKGQELYKINSVVDVNNWCSLEYLIPMGVYNEENIVGKTLTFRHGNNDEQYIGIDKQMQGAGDKIVMLDETGICGGPVADSERTMVTLESKNILMVIYAPINFLDEDLKKITNVSMQRMVNYNSGKVVFNKFSP